MPDSKQPKKGKERKQRKRTSATRARARATPAKTAEVSVSLTDDALGRLEAMVKRLEAHGLQVVSQLPSIGVVTGRIDPDEISALAKLDGVAAVERARDIQLPPPDSDVQ